MSTLIVLAVLGAGLALSMLLAAWLLVLGGRLARIADVRFRRALLAVIAYSGVGFLALALIVAIDGERLPILALAVFLGALLVTWKIIQAAFRTSLGRAFVAWLPTLLVVPLAVLMIKLVVQPHVLEAYAVTTNSMAPTIVGDHLEAPCPRCRGTLILSPSDAEFRLEEDRGICAQCLQTSIVPVPKGEPIAPDRMFALKAYRPRRWDLVVFRLPADPEVIYVKRLVGLPGEEVAIRDGEIWIDGQRQQKPAQLAGLYYSGQPDDAITLGLDEQQDADSTWGPVTLGDDEYFVLGDFSRRAFDARCWEVGAPGHSPYAVPESYLEGVVTHLYWPPRRWRVFR